MCFHEKGYAVVQYFRTVTILYRNTDKTKQQLWLGKSDQELGLQELGLAFCSNHGRTCAAKSVDTSMLLF